MLVMSWLQCRHVFNVSCLYQLKPKHQEFKANAATHELNTSAHQKHNQHAANT